MTNKDRDLGLREIYTPERLEQLAQSATPDDVLAVLDTLEPEITAHVFARLEQRGWLRKVADPAPHKPRNDEEQEFLHWIWNRWRLLMGYTDPRIKLTKIRARCVLQRFREGHTRDEFDKILLWCAGNDFMRGRDPKTGGRSYDDLTNLFTSEDKFDKYLTQALRVSRGVLSDPALRKGAERGDARRI